MTNIEMLNNELQEILNTMDVPVMRKGDFEWLKRNLAIRNKNHKDFEKATSLISSILTAILCHKMFDGNV